jgi:hypothetical protein
MTGHDQHSADCLARRLWSRFACARCRYRWEKPGTPEPGDLSRDCPLCHGQLQAVTVYRLAVTATA